MFVVLIDFIMGWFLGGTTDVLLETVGLWEWRVDDMEETKRGCVPLPMGI
jgi:hypothetical protein